MVSALDDAVGGLRGALEDHGLWNDTLLVFTTDNGGPVDGFNANEASNWPLRGGKANYFEGGVRVAEVRFNCIEAFEAPVHLKGFSLHKKTVPWEQQRTRSRPQ